MTAQVSDGVGDIESVDVSWDSGSYLNPWSGESAEMNYQDGGEYQLTLPESGTFDWDEAVEIGVEATGEYGTSTESETRTVQTETNEPPVITDVSTDVTDREITVTTNVEEGTGSITDVTLNWDSGSFLNPWSGDSAEMDYEGGGQYEYTIPESGVFDWGEDVEFGIEVTDEYESTVDSDTFSESISDDTGPPSINAVETSYDGTEVTVTAEITDDLSGVDNVDLHYDTGWTDLLGTTVSMSKDGGNTYEGQFEIGYGEQFSFDISATDYNENTDSTDTFKKQVPRGTAAVEVTNADDEAKEARIFVDGTEIGSLSVPAEATRTKEVTTDPGARTLEIKYDDADRNGETFTEQTTASIPQDTTETVEVTIPERLAPMLSVDCQNCELGSYDYENPPGVRIDVGNNGGGKLDWRVTAGMFDVIERGDDYVIVEPVAQGNFEEEVTIGVLNSRYEGEPTKSVTVSGEALIEATAPKVTWSQLPGSGVTVGEDLKVAVTGQSGSSGTDGAVDPAPAEDLVYTWYVDGEEVAKTTNPESKDVGSAASEQLILNQTGTRNIYVEVTDPNTDKSSTTETKTVVVNEPQGELVRYENPAKGDVYELDTWYDVEVVVKNTGDIRQFYEVEAKTPSGTEVQEKTKQIALDPGAETVVTFEQRLYGVNTDTRAFSHELYTVTDGERVSVDEKSVTMVQPDVGDLTLEFIDEDNNSVNADFEIHGANGELLKDSIGDKVYQFFEAGEYSISATAEGHHSTFREFTLEKDAERTLTVVVPTDRVDAAVEDIEIADGATAYRHGETVNVEATVRNTGSLEHEFFVGLGVRSPDGTVYDNEGSTGQSVTLAPGETRQVSLEWDVQDVTGAGDYDVIASTWWESDRNQLRTSLNRTTADDVFSVAPPDSFDATLEAGRTEAVTGSQVALEVNDAPSEADIDWTIEEAPENTAGALLHEEGTSTTLTLDGAGTYTVTTTITAGGETQVRHTEIQVHEETIEQLDTTADALIEKHAPVLQFHPDEQFFPTRIEAYLENAQLEKSSGAVANPSLLDLAGVGPDAAVDPETTNDEDFLQYQDFDMYPETVYTGVQEGVTYNDEEFVAVSYWYFYVNDPKPSDASYRDKLAKHTGDLEKTIILINESGPQWIAVQQHFGGEIREWSKVNKSDGRPKLIVGEGSHPTFFEPYGGPLQTETLNPLSEGAELRKLYQEQYLTVPPNAEPGSTNPHPAPALAGYTDPVSSAGPTWSPEADVGDQEYETIRLTKEMSWADYQGTLYTYPESDIQLGPLEFWRYDKGSVPMQTTVWNNPETWLTEEIAPSTEHFDGKIMQQDTDSGPDIVRKNGTVMANLTIANTGPQSGVFVLNVTAEHESGMVYSSEYGQPVNANGIDLLRINYLPEEKEVSVPIFPTDATQIESGEWDVSVTLSSYTAGIRDRADKHDQMAFTLDHDAAIDAEVAFTETPSGELTPGDTATSTVQIENTGETDHEYFVGYSAQGPDGEYYDNDGTTGKTVTVAPGESTEVSLEWNVNESLPEGEYDLVSAVWLESDRAELTTQLDSVHEDDPVTVTDTDIGYLSLTSQPSDATISVDGQTLSKTSPANITLDAGDHDVTVEATGYEPATLTVEITPGAELVRAVELNPVVTEPTVAISADSTKASTGETITFYASTTSEQQDSELIYEWDLDSDGAFDDATGLTAEHVFEQAGDHTVSVRVSNSQGDDVASTTVDVDTRGPVYQLDTSLSPETTFDVGETITAAASIENVGDQSGTIDIVLTVDGDSRATRTVELAAGQTTTEELAATLDQAGDRTIELTITGDDGEIETIGKDLTVETPSDAFVVESTTIQYPSSDDPAEANVSETVSITGTITYSDDLTEEDLQRILDDASLGVEIGSQAARIERLAPRTGVCTTAIGSDCQRQVKFELLVTVPELQQGTHDLTLTGTVPEGEDFTGTRTLHETIEQGVRVGEPTDGGGGGPVPDGVIAEISPPRTQTGVESTTTSHLVVENAGDGVGAFTATIELTDAHIADIGNVEIAGNPASVDVAYDEGNDTATIDTYGLSLTGETINLVNVTITGTDTGSSDVNLSVQAVGSPSGESYEVAQTNDGQIVVAALQPVGPFENPPTDQNGDGKFRDINGDNRADVVDVQALFTNRENQTLQNHPGKFDFNGDGGVDVVDVQRLFVETTEEKEDNNDS